MNLPDSTTLLWALARHPLRVIGRAAALGALVALASCDWVFRRGDSLPLRAMWASRWLRRCLRVGGVRISATGAPATSGLLVANHSGYLDIAVLATLQPIVFVAQHELRDLPIFGRLVRHAGTIFIDRSRKRDLLKVIAALPAVADAGALPAFFPEGATSSGAPLLPFRSSLFAPAVLHDWPVTPVHIRYTLEPGDGCVEDEVCWWGGMAFFPHLVGLLAKRRVQAHVTFGEPIPPGPDRKALARQAQRHVEALALGRDPLRRRSARSPFARKPPFPPLAHPRSFHACHSPIASALHGL